MFTSAQAADGSLTIEAYQKNEILTLKTSAISVQIYPLGVDLINKAALAEKVVIQKLFFQRV